MCPQPHNQPLHSLTPDEAALYAKFQADLWKLRAIKQGSLATSPAHNKPSQQMQQAGMLGMPGNGIVMKHEPDGTFVLTHAVKAESGVDTG